MKTNYTWQTILNGGWCGIISIVLFLVVVVLLEQLYPNFNTTREWLEAMGQKPYSQLNMAGHLIVPLAMLFMIVSFLGLKECLSSDRYKLLVQVATIFGIIACAIMVLQNTVQGTVMVRVGARVLAQTDDEVVTQFIRVFWGLRLVDQGIDLAFDMFFFIAWLLFTIPMWGHRGFGKVLSLIGFTFFAVTTVLNVWTAPVPPSFEISPFVSLWVLAVMIQMVRIGNRLKCEENSLPIVI